MGNPTKDDPGKKKSLQNISLRAMWQPGRKKKGVKGPAFCGIALCENGRGGGRKVFKLSSGSRLGPGRARKGGERDWLTTRIEVLSLQIWIFYYDMYI